MNALSIIAPPRSLIIGVMSVPDLFAALKEADREENRLMDLQDREPAGSDASRAIDGLLDLYRERQVAIGAELGRRWASFAGGLPLAELAERLS